MFNNRGEIAVVDPGDMRYLIYLALRCRSARRQWRRIRKLGNVPDVVMGQHEGAWQEAWNSFQTAKTMARVSYVDPSKTEVVMDFRGREPVQRRILRNDGDVPRIEDFKYHQRNVMAGMLGRPYIEMPSRKATYRERLQSLIPCVADAPTHDALVCLHRDIRAECMRDNRQPTAEEQALLADTYGYAKQIEALCPGIRPADLSWGPNNPRFLHPKE